MNTYELTLITKSEADSAAGKKYIEEFGGSVLERKPSATRPLAYPINKETQGTFTVFRFSMEPESVFSMNKKLVLDEKVLRHIVTAAPITRIEKSPEPVEKIAEELQPKVKVKEVKPKVKVEAIKKAKKAKTRKK